ncbi:ATP-dependent RNA helicase [Mucor velutinosus]|uniref:ATP-dependent RNA helicase n=1 Tax=Mucor velutinosus TaxID=708070 RepID=A0AAN7DG10_9FUNG|nr:ATP-dependent RNA helicase [Mucor velutinosus]
MPPASISLCVNVIVSVSKRFIKDQDGKLILLSKYDWSTPGLEIKGKTVRRLMMGSHVMYDAILDELPAIVLTMKADCLKYVGPLATDNPIVPKSLLLFLRILTTSSTIV